MTSTVGKRVRRIIGETVNESKKEHKPIEISKKAKQIITTSILAIVDDPFPYWRAEKIDLRRVQAELIARLPGLLYEVADRSPGRRITTFTLLHMLSDFLDRICPFEKVR